MRGEPVFAARINPVKNGTQHPRKAAKEHRNKNSFEPQNGVAQRDGARGLSNEPKPTVFPLFAKMRVDTRNHGT